VINCGAGRWRCVFSLSGLNKSNAARCSSGRGGGEHNTRVVFQMQPSRAREQAAIWTSLKQPLKYESHTTDNRSSGGC